MGNHVAPAQTSFNAGELSPYWAGRVDMAKYGNGCYRMRNFKPVPEGPAVRRGGSRFVSATKDETVQSWTLPFIYSEDDSYVLEMGNGYIRFYTNGGQLLLSGAPAAWNNATNYVAGDLVSRLGVNYYCKVAHINQQPPNATYWHPLTGDIYEIPSPYLTSNLTAADGTFRVDFEQTGDVIFFAHPGFPPYKLERLGVTNWIMEPADIVNGPFVGTDPDETTTVYASAATGSVTLTASTAIFVADLLETLFLLEQKKIDGYAVWEPAKAVVIGDERRSDSNVYRALNAGTTGTVKPTHREGAKYDGDGAVQWEYVHSGYGIARITAVAGTTATATVIDEIPSQAVGVLNASTRWSKASWTPAQRFPSLVTIFRERLCFLRGQEVWGSVAGSFEDFASRDGAETLPDSAFYIQIGSGETNAGVWMVASDALLVGTRGAEFAISEVTITEVFGPGNIKATRTTKYGGRQVRPVLIGNSTLFVQPSGKRVRDMRPNPGVSGGYECFDLMVLSSHVTKGQVTQMAFALEPSSVMWVCCKDGSLRGLTYLVEQDVLAWHPHQIGGNGLVESVCVIPSPDGTHDQLWLQVRRTIDGSTHRYIEYLVRDWDEDTDALEDAVFSDSALTFDGDLPSATARILGGVTWAAGETGTVDLNFVPVAGDVGDRLRIRIGSDEAFVQIDSATDPANCTFITAIPAGLQGTLSSDVAWARDVLSGLDHLEGEEVTVTVGGAAHPRATVSGGAITLQSHAVKAQVGLPADAELITMRIEAGSANGTAQGKIKRVHHCTFRLHQSLGGAAGPEGRTDEFLYRSDGDDMDEAPPTLTGDYAMVYPDGYGTEARIRIACDQALPFTLVSIYPRLVVEDAT